MRRVIGVITALIAIGGTMAIAQGYKHSDVKPFADGGFSDGTTVEQLRVITPQGTAAQIIQIKQADGTVCYGLGANSFSSPAISCIK